MLSTVNLVIALAFSVCIVENSAIREIDENRCFAAINSLYDHPVIENCCNLGYRLSVFSESVNKPGVYKFKNFGAHCQSPPTSGYCDTLSDGGGWLVVLKRIKGGSENFHRNWTDYEMGFGNLESEFWYGLRTLYYLTWGGPWEMRIDFTFSNGTNSYLQYRIFEVYGPTTNYRLRIYGFLGNTLTDPFMSHPLKDQEFSTYDRDNDKWSSGSCALESHGSRAPGGWWYNKCGHVNLNQNHGETEFIFLNNRWYIPTFIEMKIRTKNCYFSY